MRYRSADDKHNRNFICDVRGASIIYQRANVGGAKGVLIRVKKSRGALGTAARASMRKPLRMAVLRDTMCACVRKVQERQTQKPERKQVEK